MKRKPNWEAYSRNRAYALASYLRGVGLHLSYLEIETIRIYLRTENILGARRAAARRRAQE